MRPGDDRYVAFNERMRKMEKRKVITICGSSRFIEFMTVVAWLLEKEEGAIVFGLNILPYWYGANDHHQAEAEGVADHMDGIHFDKIDMGNEIFVVDRGGYIGDSTTKEIGRAEDQGKVIRLYSCDPIGKRVEEIWETFQSLQKNPVGE